MALIRVRNEADYLASNHTKQSLRPQPSLGAQIEALPLPRERFSPLADSIAMALSRFVVGTLSTSPKSIACNPVFRRRL